MRRRAFKIYLDNRSEQEDFVTIHTYDAAAAEDDQSIGGSSWELDGDDFAYAIISDKPGLVAELEADGYEVDETDYYERDEGEFKELWDGLEKKYSRRTKKATDAAWREINQLKKIISRAYEKSQEVEDKAYDPEYDVIDGIEEIATILHEGLD